MRITCIRPYGYWHQCIGSTKHWLLLAPLYFFLAFSAVGKDAEMFHLTGLIPSSNGGIAIINGKYLGIGEAIDGYKVLKILDSSVTLEKDDHTVNVQLEAIRAATEASGQPPISEGSHSVLQGNLLSENLLYLSDENKTLVYKDDVTFVNRPSINQAGQYIMNVYYYNKPAVECIYRSKLLSNKDYIRLQEIFTEREKRRIQDIKVKTEEFDKNELIRQRYMQHGGEGIIEGPLMIKKYEIIEDGSPRHPSRSIEGSVVNLSDNPLSYVSIQFSIYDMNGNVVEKVFDIINGLKPQESWKYKAIIRYDDAIGKYDYDSATYSKGMVAPLP